MFSLAIWGTTLLQKTNLKHSLINQLYQQDVWRISGNQFALLRHERGSMKQMKSKQKIAQMIPKQLLWKGISTWFHLGITSHKSIAWKLYETVIFICSSDISDVVLVLLLLSLNIFHFFSSCLYCWLWKSKC